VKIDPARLVRDALVDALISAPLVLLVVFAVIGARSPRDISIGVLVIVIFGCQVVTLAIRDVITWARLRRRQRDVDPAGGTHTRTSTSEGPDFCAECSADAQEWVRWPCPTADVDPATEFTIPVVVTAIEHRPSDPKRH
jgi:hypothetical protein